jgi:hypothetical protein
VKAEASRLRRKQRVSVETAEVNAQVLLSTN